MDLIDEHLVSWEDIEKVEVRCPTVTLILRRPLEELLNLLDRITEEDWLTPVPLFFDATNPLAVAMMDRELTPAQFSRERMRDSRIREFLSRFSYTADPLLDWKEMEEGVNAGEVTLVLRDGRRPSKFTEAMKGSYLNPVEVREKLAVCTRDILDDSRREEIIDVAKNLEGLDNIGELTVCSEVGDSTKYGAAPPRLRAYIQMFDNCTRGMMKICLRRGVEGRTISAARR